MPGASVEQVLSPYQVKRQKRRQRVAEVARAYRSGKDVLTIAAELDLTVRQVSRYLEDAAKGIPDVDADALRRAAESRLDAAAETYSSLLSDPDPRVRANAAGGLRQVEADRIKLYGLALKPRDDD